MRKTLLSIGLLLFFAQNAGALSIIETAQTGVNGSPVSDPVIGVTFDVHLNESEVGTINYLAIGNNDAQPSDRHGVDNWYNEGADLTWVAPAGWDVITLTRDESNNWRGGYYGTSYVDDWLFRNEEDWRFDEENNAVIPDFTWINTNTDFADFDSLFLFYNKANQITWETAIVPCDEGEGYTECEVETGNYSLSGYTVDTVDYYRFSGFTQSMWSPYAALQNDNTVLTGEAGHPGQAATPAPVPEPATIFLFGTGLVGLVRVRSIKKKKF